MTGALERLLRPSPPRDRRPITPDDLVDVLAHPDRYLDDLPTPATCRGLPTRAQRLALYALRPDGARRALARYAIAGRHPLGRPDDESDPVGPLPGARRAQLAAEHLADATELTVAEALAVVERHGPDLHPTRAVRLHRRMTEETS